MSGFLRTLILFAVMSLAVSATAVPLPLHKSANNRYLVDNNNNPFLMVGDAPHSLIANLSQTDAAAYLANRASNGFNCLWVEMICVPYTGGRPNGSLLNGTVPFTRNLANGNFDLTSPNSSYFSYVDTVVKMAATNNLILLLDPCDTGGLLATMTNNGSNSCWIYGQYLGNRYKSFTNIIWLSGNDYDQIYWSIPTNEVCVAAVARGIASVDTNHLQTIELGADYNFPDSMSDPNWWPIISLDLTYTFSQTYAAFDVAYTRTNYIPICNGEQHYEAESVGDSADNTEMGTPLVLRHQEYWTMLSGATGQIYGNHYIWPFSPGWQANLNTVGVTQLRYNAALFRSVEWYNLVPDLKRTLVTAGYGTYTTNGFISTNNYVTAASTPDGTLAMAYVPTKSTITVAMTNMAGLVTAQWFDPTSGSFSAIIGSPFANTGSQNFKTPDNNSGGSPDWLLLLQTPGAAKFPPPTNLHVLSP